MTRPPASSPFPPDAGDDGQDGEDTAALERELGTFFAAPTPASLRSRVLAESNRYRREQRPPPRLHADHPAETAATPDHQEAPMRTAQAQPVLAFPGQPSRRTAHPAPSGRREQPASSRTLRRVGWDSFGLVASLALIVLVALSAIAVYDGSPRGEEPTSLAGAGVSTPTATAESDTADPTAADPVYGTTDDGTSYVRIPYGDCTNVQPITFDDAMEIVYGVDYPFDSRPPLVEIATNEYFGNGFLQWSFTQLSAGDAPDQSVIDAVVETYSLYQGCENTRLRTANLLTPEGLVREAYDTPGPYLTDGGIDGTYLGSLWADGQGRQGNDEDHFGRLTRTYLYDFRLLPSGEVVAFKSENQSTSDVDALPTFYENAGYVLFAERDGKWLIDEQF